MHTDFATYGKITSTFFNNKSLEELIGLEKIFVLFYSSFPSLEELEGLIKRKWNQRSLSFINDDTFLIQFDVEIFVHQKSLS